MTNYGERIKEAYEYIHNDQREKAEGLLMNIYNEIIKLDYKKDDNLKMSLVNTISGIGEIFMKEQKFNDTLKYYELGNKITNNKDFNLLFNLGVVYINIGQEDKSKEILDLAKTIEPNNPNLLRFLSEMSGISDSVNNYYNELNFFRKSK